MGLSSQISEKEDNIFCSDVRNQLFGPMEFSRRDLAALNIMRGEEVFKTFWYLLKNFGVVLGTGFHPGGATSAQVAFPVVGK